MTVISKRYLNYGVEFLSLLLSSSTTRLGGGGGGGHFESLLLKRQGGKVSGWLLFHFQLVKKAVALRSSN